MILHRRRDWFPFRSLSTLHVNFVCGLFETALFILIGDRCWVQIVEVSKRISNFAPESAALRQFWCVIWTSEVWLAGARSSTGAKWQFYSLTQPQNFWLCLFVSENFWVPAPNRRGELLARWTDLVRYGVAGCAAVSWYLALRIDGWRIDGGHSYDLYENKLQRFYLTLVPFKFCALERPYTFHKNKQSSK